jgi:hypothetical protein
MKQKDDPAVIFEQIGSIKNWYKDGMRMIPDEELIVVVLSAVPEEYVKILGWIPVMVDTVLLIIWLVYFALMKNFHVFE